MASSSGVPPQRSTTSTRAPASVTRNLTASSSPSEAARCSAGREAATVGEGGCSRRGGRLQPQGREAATARRKPPGQRG
eukprot:scaffold75665_cov42-Phaeocystis_antarctica.AAC.2